MFISAASTHHASPLWSRDLYRNVAQYKFDHFLLYIHCIFTVYLLYIQCLLTVYFLSNM